MNHQHYYKRRKIKNTNPRDSHNDNDDHKILSNPFIIGYMSVDGGRQYHSDLSQLKFLSFITNGSISLDLNHNIVNAVKRTTDDCEENIDLLLQFITDHKQYINTECDGLDFITYRRTLISIMCNAFGVGQPLIIRASLYKNSIYLCPTESSQEILRRKSRTKEEEKYCAWGYKFEQFLLSDKPNLNPDIDRPVIENEEFSLYFKATLENLNLLYGAQIDGLLTSNHAIETPATNNFETDINFLKNNCYVELKTNREIQNSKQERNFKRYKLLRCWCQCYLAGLSGLYVGFRNDQGIVQRLQWFDTQDIPAYCQNEWNPQTAINYLHYFLTYMKECFKEKCGLQTEPITLQFELNVNGKISFSDKCKEFLPSWFIENKA